MGDEPGAECGTTFTIATRITHPSIPPVFHPAQYGYRLFDALPMRLTRVVLQVEAVSGAR